MLFWGYLPWGSRYLLHVKNEALKKAKDKNSEGLVESEAEQYVCLQKHTLGNAASWEKWPIDNLHAARAPSAPQAGGTAIC